ncbi:ribokinase [Nocardioides daeguensis]|uniref:Ribokinase n=1 Tax=Nocardioides daeguensis TaxID=908359 RepID=A0ABP6W6R9_9ACTN
MVVGSVNVDDTMYVDVLPRPGQTVLARAARQGIGGKGANQAVAARRAGATTYLLGAVGDDGAGEDCRCALDALGVDTTYLVPVSGQVTGRAGVMVAADGENAIVVAPGANLHVPSDLLDARLVGLLSDAGAADAIVLLSQGELDPVTLGLTAVAARRSGVPWVLNLGPVADVGAELLGQAAVLVVNEEELRDLADRHDVGSGPAATLAPRVRDALSCPALVVTLGARGSLIVTSRSEPRTVPALAVEKVVDTTGAGDAYVGTLAAWLAAGASLYDAAVRATAAGAAAVTRTGAQ